ncbi:MAG TPA: hypothetical protein VFW64_20735 [Pseudonocardiaceae bacterium]|nr:hypothetical protein [Pseudonocardiaceae bacterium]
MGVVAPDPGDVRWPLPEGLAVAVQPEHTGPEGTPRRVAIGDISGPAGVVPR